MDNITNKTALTYCENANQLTKLDKWKVTNLQFANNSKKNGEKNVKIAFAAVLYKFSVSRLAQNNVTKDLSTQDYQLNWANIKSNLNI